MSFHRLRNTATGLAKAWCTPQTQWLKLNKMESYNNKLNVVCFYLRRNDKGVFVSDVVKGGVAEADGRLLPGDQILSVNGEDLRNASQETAASVLKVNGGLSGNFQDGEMLPQPQVFSLSLASEFMQQKSGSASVLRS